MFFQECTFSGEAGYEKINEKIERSPFLSLNKPADISFQEKKARLYLDLEEGKTGSFQGVLGLQQQGSGSASVVGSFDLEILNLFRSGRELNVNWESFRKNSQELRLAYRHPFLFGSGVSPFFQFDLIKQDSVFIRRSTEVGFSIFFSAKTEAFIGYQREKGSLLTTDATALTGADLADFNADLYRIEIRKGRFNLLNQLKSAVAWKAGLGIGFKTIERNLNLDNTFYDTLNIETDIFNVNMKLMLNRRVFSKQTVFVHLESGVIENSELLNNERYRLGGLNSLRGFDEKILFADKYVLSRVEFRTFFESSSFAYLFFDQLVYQNDDFSDTPFGTGAGFSLATQSGQFSFAAGIGKSAGEGVDFSRLKIHFGYLTRF